MDPNIMDEIPIAKSFLFHLPLQQWQRSLFSFIKSISSAVLPPNTINNQYIFMILISSRHFTVRDELYVTSYFLCVVKNFLPLHHCRIFCQTSYYAKSLCLPQASSKSHTAFDKIRILSSVSAELNAINIFIHPFKVFVAGASFTASK